MTDQNKAGALAALAPAGRLRAAINLANPVLSSADPATGKPGGVAVDIARELGRRLGVETELIVFGSARQCVEAVQAETVDIGFFAIDPLRGDSLHFTPPYVVMEGVYVVAENSPITRNEDVDLAGHRVAVGKGSAYALFLAREFKHAQIVDVATSPDVVDTFVREGLDAAAGVRQQMTKDVARVPGLRMLDGRYMAIHQAMATSKQRGQAVFDYLNGYIEDMKASGLVADALARHRIEGAAVAAPGYPAA